MSQAEPAMHYVCTHTAARDLIKAHNRFWVSNCGCREKGKGCARSRMDVCLMFNPDDPGSGSGKREAAFVEVMGILQEAQEKQLVARPYRNADRSGIDGICFCCDDCCGYFLDPAESCDKGVLAAQTDFDLCNQCGACESACYFNARKMTGEGLTVDDMLCHGCGLCLAVCTEDCIRMVERI
jgi:ferredoxin